MRLSAQQRAVVEESFQFLTEFSRDKIIYGINTGFGPMAQYLIPTQIIFTVILN